MIPSLSYIRVSGKGQLEGDGPDRQRDAIALFASKHGYTVQQEFFEEGVSGTTDEEKRPALSAMVAAVEGNHVRHVLVERLNRLAREYRVQEHLLFYLASKEIQLIACDTGENITQAMMGDPMKKACVQMQGIFSELERSLLVIKLRKARDRKRTKTGRCEGRKPFGTKPGEGAALDYLMKLRTRTPKMTLDAIATTMQLSPYRTRTGSAWSRDVVGDILRRSSG